MTAWTLCCWRIFALCSMLLAGPSGLSATTLEPSDSLPAQSGDDVVLPYQRNGILAAGECLEFRALEMGQDVRLRLDSPGADPRIASDAEVSRYGLHSLVHCVDTEQSYTLNLQSHADRIPSNARISSRVWGPADGALLDLMQAFSKATALYADPMLASQAAEQLVAVAKRFDDVRDMEHAAIAWTLASDALNTPCSGASPQRRSRRR